MHHNQKKVKRQELESQINASSDYDIKKDPFVRVPKRVLDDPRIGPYELAVYITIRGHAQNNKVTAFPSYKTIAKESKVSQRLVAGIIKSLHAWGYVQLHKVGPRDSYMFELLSPMRCTTCMSKIGDTMEKQQVTDGNSGDLLDDSTCKLRQVRDAQNDIHDMHHMHTKENNINKILNYSGTSTCVNSWFDQGGGEILNPEIYSNLFGILGETEYKKLLRDFFNSTPRNKTQVGLLEFILQTKGVELMFAIIPPVPEVENESIITVESKPDYKYSGVIPF